MNLWKFDVQYVLQKFWRLTIWLIELLIPLCTKTVVALFFDRWDSLLAGK
jgi:hypothetical protein